MRLTELDALKYQEALNLPKFKVALDKLLNRPGFDLILSVHSITAEGLLSFIQKAIDEGNAVLIEREYNTYMVIVWKA